MPTRLAVATSGLLGALLVCGCESVVDGSRDEFSKEFFYSHAKGDVDLELGKSQVVHVHPSTCAIEHPE
jgi:hypothetical protein